MTFIANGVFLCSGNVDASGNASCSASNAPLGSDTVIATFNSLGNLFDSSGTATETVVAAPAATTNSPVAAPSSSTHGQAVTYGTSVTSAVYVTSTTATGPAPTGPRPSVWAGLCFAAHRSPSRVRTQAARRSQGLPARRPAPQSELTPLLPRTPGTQPTSARPARPPRRSPRPPQSRFRQPRSPSATR